MLSSALIAAAEALLAAYRTAGLRIATAESCTGGLVAGCLTAPAGASDVFERGFVTYSNAAKTDLLGVPAALIIEHGAVSERVAKAMATGALARSDAHVAVSVTGIAGPGGGSREKPVGLVFLGLAQHGKDPLVREYRFSGDRSAVRAATVEAALALLEGVDFRPA